MILYYPKRKVFFFLLSLILKINVHVILYCNNFHPGAEKGTDNRNLHDLDSNQKLSRDDIEKMRKEGAKGEVHCHFIL